MMLKADALFAGRFRVERLAGAGGMGIVYRANDERTGMPVALKLMSPKRVPKALQAWLSPIELAGTLPAPRASSTHTADGRTRDRESCPQP